ncbi:TonB-dependent receptor plug domain-containing protein [Chryseobacterium sp. Alg-005]|uniref:TonB-dependent receptor plug domain-containing protein n=1 Tax=Chryseobacterium sp. Alg-005 TaxID=3159516 RepID=UPI0036F295AB
MFSYIGLRAQESFKDFPKEKTYVQTNHVFFKPGEEMYCKVYVVKAENNLPAEESKVVNIELVDPSGSVTKKSKYEIKNGFAEGFFYFDTEMKGGIYKIRAYTTWMLNEQHKNIFEKEITLQKIVSPRILMKLDFPKKGYGEGDEVLADFSMRSLSNLAIPFYEADYTVMHDGEIVAQGKLMTDKEGKRQLNFKLPEVLKSSDALLTIKVNFEGFTESISRNIPIVLNNVDLKFMPEGGTFINGLEQNIAFKILDEFEKPVDATLAVFNQNNEKITETSAYNFGMGNFLLTPKKGETYHTKILKPENISKTYPLPIANEEGLILNIHQQNGKILFRINTTASKNITLKGSFREKEIYNRAISLKKGMNYFELLENDLPIGICSFTIYEHETPLAERIIFTNEHRQMNIKIKPVKQNYLPREKVILDIESTDENNKPVSANLAVSVVDDKLWTYADDKQNHLISWLLMDSELKGKIEKPQFYFDKKEEKAKKSLDLVMLTNGYRYFELIPEVIAAKKYKHLPEKINPIYGVVEDESKKPVKAEVYLVEDGVKILKQVTSENGLFYFSDLSGESAYTVVAKSIEPKRKVKIRILAYQLNINPLSKKSLNHIDVDEIIKEAVEKTNPAKPKDKEPIESRTVYNKRNSDTARVKQSQIDEVVVLGYNTMAKKGLVASTAITQAESIKNPSLASVLSGSVAGVVVTPANGLSGNSVNIQIRGQLSISNKNPLYVVDGVIVDHFNTTINPADINSVTILKDAVATSIYGSRAANGVVIINSFKNSRSQLKLDITPPSYYAVKAIPADSMVSYSYSRAFSYPAYKTTTTSFRHDYRETLYWNPVVETDKKGKAKLEFYNSDANTTFRIITEGISTSGLLGRNETTYAVQSLISIDAKIPQYVTKTDKVLIPVVVKNNSPETRKMTLDVIVPNYVRLIRSDSMLTLRPLESGRFFVEMQTNKIIHSNIQFTIRSGDFRETMILPLKVEEKGFPHNYSIINNKSENIKITVPEYIHGSFSASYYVYENTALQMFEDLERLKREPYGCFEQLSSTVYPNIFILDYLKSVKKMTPETEDLVIKNMKKGYQKMLSYKNRDGGIGYFSSAESDVALSAFALLEFRDMKKYVNIDPKLIQGLTSFILSRKNKNGLFEVRREYEKNEPYSEYAWSRNMYVLYALSKIGFKNEIEDSYKTALSRALATKDSYQLALMSNTAANLGKIEEYERLLAILMQQYENKKLDIKSTFTGSRGMSADAETLSLYIMALQKDSRLNMTKVAEAADELMNYNGYYGFGSTQATTLALEVLSDFFSTNEKLYGTEKPQMKINGAEVKPHIWFGSAFRNGSNEISVDYPSGKGLPYKLDYQYHTLQAPESSDIPLTMETKLKTETSKVGETNRMTVTIQNKINGKLPMTVAKIGIPAGLTLQNALLKDLVDKKQIAYYEIFDNYLVIYWEYLNADETKEINLDLKVEFAGEYTGKASNAYLYYTPEAKFWNEGVKAKINVE